MTLRESEAARGLIDGFGRRLAEGGIVTRCEMTTYDPDELMDLAFEDEFKVQKLIMKVSVKSRFCRLRLVSLC